MTYLSVIKKLHTSTIRVTISRTADAASQAPQDGAFVPQCEPGPVQTTSISNRQRPRNRKSKSDVFRHTNIKTKSTMAGASKNNVARPRRVIRMICRSRYDICADTRCEEKDAIRVEAARSDNDSVVLVPSARETDCAVEDEYDWKAIKYRTVLYVAQAPFGKITS